MASSTASIGGLELAKTVIHRRVPILRMVGRQLARISRNASKDGECFFFRCGPFSAIQPSRAIVHSGFIHGAISTMLAVD